MKFKRLIDILLILPCLTVKKIVKILNTPINFQSKKMENFNSLEEAKLKQASPSEKGDASLIKQKYVHNDYLPITSDEYQELINQIKELIIEAKENQIELNRLYRFSAWILFKKSLFWIFIILTFGPYVLGGFLENLGYIPPSSDDD